MPRFLRKGAVEVRSTSVRNPGEAISRLVVDRRWRRSEEVLARGKCSLASTFPPDVRDVAQSLDGESQFRGKDLERLLG